MRSEGLQPELKFMRAQDAQRGVVARVRSMTEHYARDEMSVDDLEVLALQLRLASINLLTSARELREVEEERRMLLRELEKQRLRFEPEGGADA